MMLRCSHEAFAQCPTRALCGNVHEATFTEDSECAKFNRSIVDKPMTNADRIRAMSDEELAENASILFIDACEFIKRDEDPTFCEKDQWRGNLSPCSLCILNWLQQPVSEVPADG